MSKMSSKLSILFFGSSFGTCKIYRDKIQVAAIYFFSKSSVTVIYGIASDVNLSQAIC